MRKILLIIVTLIAIVGLLACDSAREDNDLTLLPEQQGANAEYTSSDVSTFDVVKLSSSDDNFIEIEVRRYGVTVLNYFRKGDRQQDIAIHTYHTFFSPLGEPRYIVASDILEDGFTDSIVFAFPISPSELGATLDENNDWLLDGRWIGFQERLGNNEVVNWLPFEAIADITDIDYARGFPTGVLYDKDFIEDVLHELNDYMQAWIYPEATQFRFVPYMETVDIFQILGFDWAE